MGRECQSGQCQPRSGEQTMQWRLHGRAAASHQLHKAPAAMAAPPSMCNPVHYRACSAAPGTRNTARQRPKPAHLPLRFSAMTMSLLVTVARCAYSVRTTASPMMLRKKSLKASSAPSCGSSSMPLPMYRTPAGQGAGPESRESASGRRAGATSGGNGGGLAAAIRVAAAAPEAQRTCTPRQLAHAGAAGVQGALYSAKRDRAAPQARPTAARRLAALGGAAARHGGVQARRAGPAVAALRCLRAGRLCSKVECCRESLECGGGEGVVCDPALSKIHAGGRFQVLAREWPALR